MFSVDCVTYPFGNEAFLDLYLFNAASKDILLSVIFKLYKWLI